MTRPLPPPEAAAEDPLEELPPLDDGDDEDAPDDIDFGLPQLEREPLDDDTPCGEFETGIELSEPEDVEDDGAVDLGIRLESLLGTQDSDENEDDDDAPIEVGTLFGAGPVPEGAADGGEDGTGEDLDFSIAGELPALDADEDDTSADEDLALPAASRDDAPLRWAPQPWEELRIVGVDSACTALAVGLGVVTAAGQELFWLAGAEQPTPLASPGSRVESIALVGQTKPAVLCATDRGLIRIRAESGSMDELRSWREAAGLRADEHARLRLCQMTEDCPQVLVALTSRGQLLRSQDGGASFMRLDLGAKVLALSPRGMPLLTLIAGERSPTLAWSDDFGVSWSLVDLDATAREIALGDAPLVAASDSLFVVADRDRGLALSSDRGRSFTRIAGCADTTALAAGTRGGRAAAWTALYREARGATEIVEIDPVAREAVRVALLTESDDEDLDRCRVRALSWDGGACRLWLAGDFGLSSVAPPRG